MLPPTETGKHALRRKLVKPQKSQLVYPKKKKNASLNKAR